MSLGPLLDLGLKRGTPSSHSTSNVILFIQEPYLVSMTVGTLGLQCMSKANEIFYHVRTIFFGRSLGKGV